MTSTHRDPMLVVIQLTGGNDYMNTVVPYGDPLYQDNRPGVGVPIGDVLPIDGNYGFNPALAPFKEIYDDGQTWPLSTVSDIRDPTGHISAPWTSGIPASRSGSPLRVGWAG